MIPSNDDFPSFQDCLYTPYYCEENIWKLCEKLQEIKYCHLEDCVCVFISNKNKCFPLCYQKEGTGVDNFVAWDYHVILVRKMLTSVDVYDFDTVLGFPVSFEEYVRKAIGSEENLDPQYHRYFRAIPALTFLSSFASDRSHMKNEEGEWIKPPPSYNPITTQTSSNNLAQFIDMDSSVGVGRVMNLSKFIRGFNGRPIDFKKKSK